MIIRSDGVAAEQLKSINSRDFDEIGIRRLLKRVVMDKGYNVNAVRLLAKQSLLDVFMEPLFFRRNIGESNPQLFAVSSSQSFLNLAGAELDRYTPAVTEKYIGAMAQNAAIDGALSKHKSLRSPANFFGNGMSSVFFNGIADGKVRSMGSRIVNVPIAIIGYGASGILIHYALARLGFVNVRVYDKSNPLGIWSIKDVFGRSRNNPRLLKFFSEKLEPAPGGGDEVKKFLETLSIANPIKENIVAIKPGTLNHELVFGSGDTRTFPIVINAIGLGKPKPIADRNKMTTTDDSQSGGYRWQRQLTEEDVRDKRLIFIGLGNSTAEMLRQIHDFMDQGIEVDYRVVTHYPREAIMNPDYYINYAGEQYRVFRDISIPNLVDYQGDLPESRDDYFRALNSGRIITDVKSWSSNNSVFTAFGGFSTLIESIPFDTLYTLIGYRHSKETMTTMGCSYDDEHKCALFDYDGEAIARPEQYGRERLHIGYFGFGSILETPKNPNAIVIPGMLHRIGDVLFSIIMRAAEYAKI